MARARKPKTEFKPELIATPGYSGDGVSAYSHALANGQAVARRFRDRLPPLSHRLDDFIKHQQTNVARLQRRLADAEATGDAIQIELATLRLDKTSALLARLLAEKAAT